MLTDEGDYNSSVSKCSVNWWRRWLLTIAVLVNVLLTDGDYNSSVVNVLLTDDHNKSSVNVSKC